MKCWWEEDETVRIEEYSGLDDQTLQILMQEQTDVMVMNTYPDQMMGQLHDVQIKRKITGGRVRIMSVPPEELLLDRRAR